MTIIALFVLAIIVATLVLSSVIRNAAITVIIAVIVCVIGFQMFAYMNLGYLDPFFQIAAAVQTAIGLLVASATMGITRVARRSREQYRREGH